jgi:hypothetical protein
MINNPPVTQINTFSHPRELGFFADQGAQLQIADLNVLLPFPFKWILSTTPGIITVMSIDGATTMPVVVVANTVGFWLAARGIKVVSLSGGIVATDVYYYGGQ